MAVDVHEAVYQHLAEVLGCPDNRDDIGLVLSYDLPTAEDGCMLYTHYLVVRDGLISREKWVELNGKHEKAAQYDTVDLCDPDSLDFHAIRDLAR